MATEMIYRDIAERTGGDIYIGVVGPVRSGKSTFITRFMQELVLPNMRDEHSRERARDEMPQSAAGFTVMTTEPKFVPDEAVPLTVGDGVSLRVKMIDCVGYMIPEAMGGEENGEARMVKTPWSEEPMPFGEAAELGTKKVIGEHATIGMLVTSDGTVGELPREAYVEAEARLVSELKALGKPFAVVLNSADPQNEASRALALRLEGEYGVPVALVSCLSLNAADIGGILSMVLGEFPVTSIGVRLPDFVRALTKENALRAGLMQRICEIGSSVCRMGEVGDAFAALASEEAVEAVRVTSSDMGTGRVEIEVALQRELYYRALSEAAGEEIENDGELLSLVRTLANVREQYDRVSEALEAAHESGYGIVMPRTEELHMEKPAIVKQSGGFGVRLRATAPSIHMIRADIVTELSPMIGTEAQSEAFMKSILEDLADDPVRLWHTDMFGKSLFELVNDGIKGKLAHMPEEARRKLAETLERIINEGSNGLLCILL